MSAQCVNTAGISSVVQVKGNDLLLDHVYLAVVYLPLWSNVSFCAAVVVITTLYLSHPHEKVYIYRTS